LALKNPRVRAMDLRLAPSGRAGPEPLDRVGEGLGAHGLDQVLGEAGAHGGQQLIEERGSPIPTGTSCWLARGGSRASETPSRGRHRSP
jgi:hypothetical protein